MKISKLIVVTLALFLIFNSFGLLRAEDSSDYTASDTTEEVTEAPRLIIGSEGWLPVLKAGEKSVLSIPIENISPTSAKDVVVSLSVTDPDKGPFNPRMISLTQNMGNIGSQKCSARFNVEVPSDVKPGVFSVGVNANYRWGKGNSGQDSATIYVKVANDSTQPDFSLVDVNYEGGRLPAGKSTMVNLIIKNEGGLPAKNVDICLGGFSGSGLSLDKWPDTKRIASFGPGESKTVQFRIHVDTGTKNGTYVLDLSIDYAEDSQQDNKQALKVYLPVAGKNAEGDDSPRIIIDNYQMGGIDHVIAGQSFPLILSFINTSNEVGVSNIKVSLNSDGQIFVPIGGSNTLFIREIPAGSRVEKTVQLKPKENAEYQTYSITADIDYQDEDGNKCTDKELISIPVYQKMEFTVSDVKVPQDQIFVGSEATISVDMYNTGRALIRNLRIHTEGDFDIKDNDLFIGNMEAGKNDYYDVNITPRKEGSVEGKIIMDYDDNAGEHYQAVKYFTISAGKQITPPMLPVPPENAKSKFVFKWWMIPAGLVVPLFIAFLVYRRRRKLREEIEFDE